MKDGFFSIQKVFFGIRGKVLILLLAIVFTAGLAGCSSGDSGKETGGEEETEPVKLDLAHFFPPNHPAETELVQPWAEDIEEATEGRVKITSYPGETLAGASEIYDGVVSGVSELGLSCFAYTRGRFPVSEVFELPGIRYENSKVASKVSWEGLKELEPEEVEDTKLMMTFATGPGDLLTKVPVETLEDVQGLEVRATGLSAKTLKALGASPVARPQSDTYEALSRNVVDGNLGPVEVLKGWNNAEVTDYVTRTPFLYNTIFFITMNRDVWNSLSSEDQEVIEEINEQYFEEVAMKLWDMQNEEALEWAIEETGQEVLTLPEEEQERWIEKVMPIQDDFVETMDEKGYDGEEILNTVKELAEQYNEELQ